MLAKDAKHPNCMLMWMDWMSQPETQQQVAEYFGEAPANLAACALMDSDPGPYGYEGNCEANHASDDAYCGRDQVLEDADRRMRGRPRGDLRRLLEVDVRVDEIVAAGE